MLCLGLSLAPWLLGKVRNSGLGSIPLFMPRCFILFPHRACWYSCVADCRQGTRAHFVGVLQVFRFGFQSLSGWFSCDWKVPFRRFVPLAAAPVFHQSCFAWLFAVVASWAYCAWYRLDTLAILQVDTQAIPRCSLCVHVEPYI